MIGMKHQTVFGPKECCMGKLDRYNDHKRTRVKMHGLALSMHENKTLNLKDITLLKLLQDIMLLISILSFVQETDRAQLYD
jgi:hypothetical protein